MTDLQAGLEASTRRLRRLTLVAGGVCLAVVAPQRLPSQGITTSTIRGKTTPEDATVVAENAATGFRVETQARHGRYSLQGLAVGGPYVVRIRRIGFTPQERAGIYLTLGQSLELDFALPPVATPLDTLRVNARERREATSTTVPDALLHRLPTLNRDMYDFARLAPQISTKVALVIGGISGGGANVRFNNFLIDGSSDRTPTGNTASGRSVPIDAVQEYQVLLAPFDVRYGDFAGAVVNAVTRSGTNVAHGSAFVYERNESLARPTTDSLSAPYQRTQFGFVAGGPLVHDRLQYFVAPEFQRLTAPARGPFLGQDPTVLPKVPVQAADVVRFASLMRAYGLDAGSGGPVSVGNPLTNLFGRLDGMLPRWNSRVVFLESYARADNAAFSRADTFSLSSYRVTQANAVRLTSAQLHTNLRGNGYNAVTLSYRTGWTEFRPDVRSPLVMVQVPKTGGGIAVLKAGSQEGGNGVSMGSRSISVSEQLTVPVAASHDVLVGGQAELLRLDRGGVNGSYGAWTFSSLDSLQRGVAERYQVNEDFGSSGLPLRAAQYALFVSDEWRAGNRVSITLGVRGDLFDVLDHAPYNAEVNTLFGRRTDRSPAAHLHVSPRLGLTWDVFGTGGDQIRAGAGVFTGRFPPAWAHTAIYSYGSGIGTLSCGALPNGPAPAFVPDYRAPPTTCANGNGQVPKGDVDLLDRHLRMAQSARLSLAYDRRLPWELTATVEAMHTRNLNDFVFANLNLAGPQGVDRHGRVVFGKVGATGVASPAMVSGFSEVIDVQNVSANHAFQVDARLERRFSHGFGATASYTFTRVRDVALPIRSGMRGTVNWVSQRVVSGRHDDLSAGTSLYDIPHRVVVAGTFAATWHRLTTEVSLYYVGESGSPFTYVAGGPGRRGDLNADGAAGNDPIYVPSRATDTTEIRFAADAPGADVAQQRAFDQFIDGAACLRRQRGSIMRRNSCREPWSHTSIASLRQSLPAAGTHAIALHLDVFNVLNLISSHWGQYLVASPMLLSQVGETAGPPDVAQPIFQFDSSAPRWLTLATESAYQLQLALRVSY